LPPPLFSSKIRDTLLPKLISGEIQILIAGELGKEEVIT